VAASGAAVILPADALALAAAARVLRDGGLLGLPTETVYGLAADADNATAVAQIFTAKGRPANHPLIVHVAQASAVDHYASEIPDFARALMAAFWPGPLTLILPRRPAVAAAAAGGQSTVGLRCPAHPVAQALLRVLLESLVPVWGLAAPSANQFGRVSPTTAAHVAGEFGPDLLILDGGPCFVGIESSIIDCSRGQPVLLRPGAISAEQVQAACGLTVLAKDAFEAQAAPAPQVSGSLESHYAPRARVRLLDAAALDLAWAALVADSAAAPAPAVAAAAGQALGPSVGIWSGRKLALSAPQCLWQPLPGDATSAAQQLFATLRAFDAQGVSEIWVEIPPASADWDGVRDRLQRAAH
jgi:L-threonylcarbamoyladenylate synthase